MICSGTRYNGFCSLANCEILDTTTPAPAAGDYKLVFDFMGAEYTIPATFDLEEVMKFPLDQLNEHCEVVAQIINSAGENVPIRINTLPYETFVISTNLKYDL